ncbi:MAG: hypothetical protein IRZ19_07835, partial [Pyrinomonas methylaliphatogenes]|nr:hypothetical protein [Pyrinomonas methylaliphatogenes]
MMSFRRQCDARSIALLLLLLFAQRAVADRLPTASPAAVGISAERLAEIDRAVEQEIAQRRLPGAVVLVA